MSRLQALEEGRDLRQERRGRGAGVPGKTERPAGSAVGFERGGVLRELRRVRCRIRLAARQAVLLVREEDEAHRPARPRREGRDLPRGLDDDAAARSVVDGSAPEVPGVEVRAEDDDFVRRLAARDLSDHVGRFGVGPHAAGEREPHPHGPAAGEEAREQIRVRDRERGRRNLRSVLRVLERSRVGKAVGVGADRTHQDGGRTEPPRARRALGTIDDGLAVARSVLRALHRNVEEDDLVRDGALPRFELLERPHADHLGLDASLRRAHTVSERGEREQLRDGSRDLPALGGAGPDRDDDLLGVDVREADALEHVERDGYRGPVAGRAGEPRSGEVRELAHPLRCA